MARAKSDSRRTDGVQKPEAPPAAELAVDPEHEVGVAFKAAIKSVRRRMLEEHPTEPEAAYCGKCSFGWIIRDGRARRCPCNARRGVGLQQDWIDAVLNRHRAGLSKRLASVSAHTFLVRPSHEHIKLALDQYIRNLTLAKQYGFLIHGPSGAGKSWAAAYVVNTVRHRRIMTAAMVNFSRTLTALRSTFRDEDEHKALRSILFDTPLLAIDDLGMERKVNENPELSWAVEQFYQVIDYRRDEDLPTIITTNKTIEELRERLGDPVMTRISHLTLRLDIELPRSSSGD
jgi:DNA replication protein DnaC